VSQGNTRRCNGPSGVEKVTEVVTSNFSGSRGRHMAGTP
jgi:hypothetical protein